MLRSGPRKGKKTKINKRSKEQKRYNADIKE